MTIHLEQAAQNNLPAQPYKYNGIGLEKSFGLETYEAFYRGLDPQLGRFNSIDPRAATSFSISPYASMGNNPVSNVDYLGDIFTFANAGLQNSYNNLRSDNNSRMAGYTKELGGLDLKTESGAKRGEELTKLINAHAEFNTQLDAMEQSSAEFHISNEAAPRGFQGGADYNWSEGRVKFSMGSNSVGSGILAHELRHGYGYLIGELSGSRYDDPLYDMTDEVVAYKTASLFGTESDAIKFGVGSWGIKEFAGSIETNGYRNLKGREVSLTINTPASILINYSKDGSLNNFIKSSNNANLTVGEAISSFNQITKSTQGSERYLWGNQLKRK